MKEIIQEISYFSLPNQYYYNNNEDWEKEIKAVLDAEKLPITLKYSKAEGYKIVTNKQNIHILIQGGQQCCEEWGYEFCSSEGIIETKDDFKDFIGAELISIESVEPETHNGIPIYNALLEEIGYYRSEIAAEFVNIKTSNGLLQFAVYNCHNGYYGHKIYINFNNEVINSQL